jgi:hypothetical protein
VAGTVARDSVPSVGISSVEPLDIAGVLADDIMSITATEPPLKEI